MIVFFTGITPWRTHAWSQARNPGQARLVFHMVNGCPAVVIPIKAHAPILAWSPWTLKQLHDGDVQPAQQYEEVFRYLDSIIEIHSVEVKMRQNYKNLVAQGLRMIIKGAMQIKTADRKVWDMIDPDRAGIAMFRY